MVTKKKERQNRKLLEGLPVVEVVIEPQDLDFTKYKRIGKERTRTLKFEPDKLYVKKIIRPKYGLKDNTALPQEYQGGIVIADLPLLPIYKGLPGASLLAEILLQKYEYHVPFYRQIQEFHHLGLKIRDIEKLNFIIFLFFHPLLSNVDLGIKEIYVAYNPWTAVPLNKLCKGTIYEKV